MKSKLIIFIVGLLLILPTSYTSASEHIALFVNGNYITSNVEPIMRDGRVMLPIRTISASLGVSSDNIHWDKTNKIVTILKNNRVVQLTLNKKTMIINGEEVDLDAPAKIVEGRTMLPLRNIAQALGLEVSWNSNSKTVVIKGENDRSDKIADEIRKKLEEINNKNSIQDNVKLTSKDIAKLRNRVGIVYTIDKYNNIVSQGSGFFLSSDGLFVTNYHVVKETGIFKVFMQDGRIFSNNGYYTIASSKSDIFAAYLTIENNKQKSPSKLDVNYFNVNLNLPEVGDKIYVIGSPEGLENTLSQGIVSGIRTNNGKQIIQIDASITHGSSGGALINENGELIGITSNGIEGTDLNFAIPIKYFNELYNKVIEKEEPYYD